MKFFIGFKKGMMLFGSLITTIINTVLLFIVYLVGVGLTALVARVFNKRFLETKLGAKSYWRPLKLKKEEMDSYYRQF